MKSPKNGFLKSYGALRTFMQNNPTVTLPKVWAQLVSYIQTIEHEKAGLLAKSEPRLPEFELRDISELSKLVESILVKWRKV